MPRLRSKSAQAATSSARACAPDTTQESGIPGAKTRGNLIVHSDPNDVSIISAGRDIIYANFDVAGPGMLEVSAGRNLYQADKGSFTSIGPVANGDTRPGASIAMLAGVGASGPDYNALASRYLDPAIWPRRACRLPISRARSPRPMRTELAAWLKERHGFVGLRCRGACLFRPAGAGAATHLPAPGVFRRTHRGWSRIQRHGQPRFLSICAAARCHRGAVPGRAQGNPIAATSPCSARPVCARLSGGDIQLLAPGRAVRHRCRRQVPAASSGLVTQGSGDIQIYSQGSILLGLSRIMTTFGGNILAWSAEGDINAGRGAKTTVIYTPPKRVYDKYGNVVLSPQVPSTGAGIATLNPIPEVLPGDIDLIAPLGTIDAGEAGIRVSGNVNLAALQIVNAANIQVQGTSSGIPTVQAPSISAALSTSNATAATQQTATPAQTPQ
jgi:hypothetical protein